MSEITKIVEVFKEKNSFLVTAHDSPCGDAIASGLALSSILKRIGKKVFLLNGELPPPNLSFLPGAEEIKTNPGEGLSCEAAVVLDCANANRIGQNKNILGGFDLIINIDHHISNDCFGALNYVDPDAASTGEQVFTLSKYLVDDINKDEATCLYTTLVMDTGSFKYSNTKPKTHRLAALFLEKGVDPAYISDEIYGNFSSANRKLLGKALSNIKISECGRIASVMVTRKMLDEFGARENETQDFIDYIQSVKDVLVSFCLREMSDGRIKVNFRSKTVDVNKLASAFGGGGHARAAGCSFEGTSIREAEEKVLEAMKKFL
jgi:bifunctional oligoribonuclease and PAP phosphatase NrnA